MTEPNKDGFKYFLSKVLFRSFLTLFRLSLWHACCLAVFVLALCMPAFAQNATTNVKIVEIDLARHVAIEHVHANNRPYQWRGLDHKVLYDINGSPNGYAFIFSKVESGFNGPEALRQHIGDSIAAARAKQDQEAQSSGDNNLFVLDDLATVITGATTESPLILRHFRGLPEFWIEAVKMEASRQAGASTAIHVAMVTPMDFQLVSTEAIAAPASAATERAAMALPASAEAISVRSKKVERIRALRQRTQEREERTRKRIESMTLQQRQRHETALEERKGFLRSQWEAKRAGRENRTPSDEEQK